MPFEEPSPNLTNNPPLKKRKWYFRWWAILVFTVIILFLIGAVAVAFQVFSYLQQAKRGEISFTPASEINGELEKGSRIVAVSPDDDPYAGSPDAKVTIIAFEDFECEFCREAFPIIRELISTYGNKIYFVYRDFPNSKVHKDAQKAHEAAECADDQGKFWEMHDKIYQNQENINVPDLKNYAQSLGLNFPIFSACLDSGKYEKEVKKDFSDGLAAEVRGTPTWFINGRKFEGVIPFDVFQQLIDLSLKE